MYKRVVALCIALLAAHGVASAAPLNVVATTSTFADLVKAIGGDYVEVSYIAPPKFNVHFIEPRPSDVMKVKKAVAFAHAGLDLEAWSAPLRDAAGNRSVMKGGAGDLDLSRGVLLLEVPDRTVSRAVQIAGVLMVFALLIAPAVCGVFLGGTMRGRLVIAWIAGVLTCVAGIFASYHWDLPTGAAIVCAFGVTVIVCGALRSLLGITGNVEGTH